MKRTSSFFATMLFASAALAQSPQSVPAPLDVLGRGGEVKVQKSFDAGFGVRGWVVTSPDGPTVVYTTPDGKALFVGQMFGPDGQNLTKEHVSQHVPKPDYRASFEKLRKATHIVEGPRDNPKAVLYAFMDPNCVYCYFAQRALKPYVDAGLQVRWVPVAILGPTSTTRAAAILQAPNPSEALEQHKKLYSPTKPGSGIPPAATVSERTRAILDEGLALMREFGFRGTPGFVWSNANGEIQTRSGMMQLRDIPQMTGMPLITNDDPELARFR